MTFYNKNSHNRKSIRLKGRDYSKPDLYFITICCQDRISRFGEIIYDEMILNQLGIIAYNEWMKLPKRYMNVELDVFQIMPDHIHAIVSLTNVGATLAVARDNTMVTSDNTTVARDDTTVAHDHTTVAGDNTMVARDNTKNIPGNTPVTDDGTPVGNHQTHVHDLTGQPQGLPLQFSQHKATIGSIIGGYKSIVSNEILKIYKSKNEIMGKLWQRNYYEHIIRNHESYMNISNYIIDNPKRWNEKRRGDPCGRP